VSILPYDLELDYDSWTYGMVEHTQLMAYSTDNASAEIAAAVLPQNEEMPEVPQGFTQVGHVCTYLPR